MKKIIAPLLFCWICFGCAVNPVDLKPAEDTTIYVLSETSTVTVTRGIGFQWVEGLRAGNYHAEYEDANGVFYRGPKDCVILLVGELADEFLNSGKLPTNDEKIAKQELFSGQEGGIWMPKEGVNKEPRFYHYFEPNPTIAQGYGALVMGLIEMDRGKINFGPVVTDENILSVFSKMD